MTPTTAPQPRPGHLRRRDCDPASDRGCSITGSVGWSGFPRHGAPGRGTAPQSAMTSTSPSDVKAPRHARPFHRPDVAGLLHSGQHPGIRGLQLDDLRPQRGGHRLVTGRHLQPQQTAAAVSRPCPNPHTRSPPRGSHSASNTRRGQASARASADVEVPGAPLPETNAINTCNPPLTRAAPRRWRPCPRPTQTRPLPPGSRPPGRPPHDPGEQFPQHHRETGPHRQRRQGTQDRWPTRSPPGSRSPSGAFPRAGRARHHRPVSVRPPAPRLTWRPVPSLSMTWCRRRPDRSRAPRVNVVHGHLQINRSRPTGDAARPSLSGLRHPITVAVDHLRCRARG